MRYLNDVKGLSQVLAEYNESETLLREYTYGMDLISQTAGGATSYYHYDALGSVRQTTDSLGAILTVATYEAFGTPIVGTPSYGFTGEGWDTDASLLYLRARYYDPSIGRFISVDPLVEAIALSVPSGCSGGGCGDSRFGSNYFLLHPQELHPYAYCGNNPVNRIDPSGKYIVPPWFYDIPGWFWDWLRDEAYWWWQEHRDEILDWLECEASKDPDRRWDPIWRGPM